MPAPTSRRLMSATSSREAPGGRVTVSPASVREVPAAIPASLMSRPARAADQLVDRALADDPAAVHDRHRIAGALHLVQQV